MDKNEIPGGKWVNDEPEALSNELDTYDRHEANDIEQSEEMREYLAKELGLPKDASWEEVTNAKDEDTLTKSALALGLEKNATWDEIHAAENGDGDRISKALVLGLSRDATYAEIVEATRLKRRALLAHIKSEIRFNRAKAATPQEGEADNNLLN